MNSDFDNKLDTTELLAQLKGVHLPEAPVPADLWPVVLSLAVCAIALLVFAIKHIHVKRTWHRTALDTLAIIDKRSRHQPYNSLQQTAVLLKRISLTTDERKTVKHLTGDAWLRHLDTFFSTNYFTCGNGRIFGSALYQVNTTAETTVLSEIEKLIKRHKRQHP